MTSRFLYRRLSPVVTRGRNIFSKRIQLQFNFVECVNATENISLDMPVIHAVAAHRHCHNLCQQPHLLHTGPGSGDRLYTKTKSDVRILRSASFISAAPVLERQQLEVLPTSSSGWLKVRSKSFLSSAKSAFNQNIFGPASISEDINNGRSRYYSKTKDKGSKKKAVVIINQDEMNEVIDSEAFRGQLEGILKQMKDEYASHLSVRGAAGALELLEVEFDGEKYPLQELAQVGRKNPQLAVLNLASLPDACQAVMKAIQESGMQLNPQQEGTTIYIPLPKVTREHRENLAKNAKAIFTKYKTSLQQIQNKFIKQCKSQKDISEDIVFSVTQQITRLTEQYIGDAERVLQDKQKELLDTIS